MYGTRYIFIGKKGAVEHGGRINFILSGRHVCDTSCRYKAREKKKELEGGGGGERRTCAIYSVGVPPPLFKPSSFNAPGCCFFFFFFCAAYVSSTCVYDST